MIRAILSKEWHEHSRKYGRFWLALNTPIIVLCLVLAISTAARTPFADLSDATAWKYLPLSLAESFLLATVFVIVAGYLAVATFSPEIENRSVFFIFEQPVPRKQYIAIKLLNGAVQVVAATCFAMLLAPLAVYAMMLVSGKVTVAGSGGALAAVMAASARAAIWCALIALAGFSASAMVATLMPRWPAIGSVLLIMLLGYLSSDFFDFSSDIASDSMSIGLSFSTSNAQWLTVSRALKPAELANFAHWKALPLFTTALLTAVCSVATTLLYDRKEFK